jgi:hypothetical protein
MDIDERIEVIKNQIGITGIEQDSILSDLFERYLSVAKQICLRDDAPDALLDIVQDIASGAYHQRGGEGFESSNAGNQSYNHIDLHEIMRERLITSGLRLARF